jgi:rare lipoprotein A
MRGSYPFSMPVLFACAAALLGAAECAAGEARGQSPAQPRLFTTEVVKVHHEVGIASFYSGTGRTASGMKPGGMTAAHRLLPFGSHVKVKDLKTGREVTVMIVDRGPFQKSRVIDLSHQAAQELGIVGRGVAKVELVSQ